MRVVLQYLEEVGLRRARAVLEEESGVGLNAVADVGQLRADCQAGRWDAVLRTVAAMRLPYATAAGLVEHLFLELLLLREVETARALLHDAPTHSPSTTHTHPERERERAGDTLRGEETVSGGDVAAVVAEMRVREVERYARLQRMLGAADAAAEAAAHLAARGGREAARAAVAESVACEVRTAAPGRLLALLGQAQRHQALAGLLPPGRRLDLFAELSRASHARNSRAEAPVARRAHQSIAFAADARPEAAAYSPCGHFLATASSDGFVELWDAASCRLRADLPYQREEAPQLLRHSRAVLALAWSADGQLLASGCGGGTVKVWHVASGRCVRRFASVCAKGVTALAFGREGRLLAASFDGCARVLGLQSGAVLHLLRHESFVNDCAWSAAGEALTCASDGTARVWDAATGAEVRRLPSPAAGQALHSLAVREDGAVLLCGQAPSLSLLAADGSLLHCLGQEPPPSASPSAAPEDFVRALLSPRGRWAYALGCRGGLFVFDLESGQLHARIDAHAREARGMAHHPHRALLATFADEPLVKLWRRAPRRAHNS